MKTEKLNPSQKTASEIRAWYEKNASVIENFERSSNALQLLDPKKNYTKTSNTFNKDTLRTYMKNPTTQFKNLRNLSRYLYYRSQVYRRIIHYNANMINLNYRSVIPLIDIVKGGDKKKTLKAYYDTLSILETMNLPLEFLKVYITCWREDVFFGCAYSDDTGFFILPIDPDYCKITGIYPTGDFAFDMDMSYFSRKVEVLEMWGEPFTSMYRVYEGDTTNEKWQPMPDEYAVCMKINVDDWETPLPPYLALFDRLINLEDLAEISAIADEQQIYQLLALTMPILKNASEANEWAVDPATVVDYYNKILDTLPDYTNAILTPAPVESITFNQDQASDVNKLENATKSVLNTSGGAQVLNSSTVSGTTAWTGAIKSDEDYAISALLPQTQAYINRFLSGKLAAPAKVKFLEVTRYTKDEYKNQILKDATYGLPSKLLLNTLNGFTELETISMNFLEEECLELSSKFMPLQSSNTTAGADLQEGRPKSDKVTDDGEASTDKKDKSK